MPRRFALYCQWFVCIALLLLCGTRAHASAIRQTDNKALAMSPQWLALLHMQKNNFTGGYRSEVDARTFFLSSKDDDSAAELHATITALQSSPATGDSSAWCRFPARAQFLSQHIPLRKPENLHCPALDYWRGRFSADEITLVYPDPYLKKIASIFGHTFLRVDAYDKTTHPVLLSQAISYYADVGATDNSPYAPDVNELKDHKGAIGGYFKISENKNTSEPKKGNLSAALSPEGFEIPDMSVFEDLIAGNTLKTEPRSTTLGETYNCTFMKTTESELETIYLPYGGYLEGESHKYPMHVVFWTKTLVSGTQGFSGKSPEYGFWYNYFDVYNSKKGISNVRFVSGSNGNNTGRYKAMPLRLVCVLQLTSDK